ncbi:hypothetical protein ALO_20397 [Acetonema longum DSM 6540]|uniref:Uncharacterized protein n=1 Tax=Acetonema longum DSM 6540 TaxID=1009370 RepID=F7NPN2_9FIRM|nr:hypothetical protein ALO_20397 [Acetonema longum DSM 6540]
MVGIRIVGQFCLNTNFQKLVFLFRRKQALQSGLVSRLDKTSSAKQAFFLFYEDFPAKYRSMFNSRVMICHICDI